MKKEYIDIFNKIKEILENNDIDFFKIEYYEDKTIFLIDDYYYFYKKIDLDIDSINEIFKFINNQESSLFQESYSLNIQIDAKNYRGEYDNLISLVSCFYDNNN
jgi:hypothetical protein